MGCDISLSSFSQRLDEKKRKYEVLVCTAENVRRDHQNQRTKEEANLYLQAADVCAEIMSMSQGEQYVYSRWERRKLTCENEVRQIVALLQPVAPAQPAAARPTEPAQPEKPEKGEADTDAPTAGQSGDFVTRNASSEVPAEKIKSWYKKLPNTSFDDLVGMDELHEDLKKQISIYKYHLMQECLDLGRLQTFVFYGPPGTGKTTVVEAFARELMENENYKFLQVSGGKDILDKHVGVAEKKVAALFDEAVDNAPCIIFVDELENVCANRKNPNVVEHQRSLTVAFLEGYNRLKEANVPVVFIGATNLPENIDAAMLDRVSLIEIGLPGPEMRQKFFEKKLAKVHLEEGLTTEDLAAETENYSFRDLQELIQSVLAEFGDRTIKEYRRQTPDGKEDVEATDAASAAAIAEGKAVLTRELFSQMEAKQKLKTDINGKTPKDGV